MGRAQKHVPKNSNQGFVSQIDFVGRAEPSSTSSSKSEKEGMQTNNSEMSRKKRKKARRQKNDRSQSKQSSLSSERIMAQGGGAVANSWKQSESRGLSEKKKSRRRHLHKPNDPEEDDMGDLIGGVMNRGKLDSEYNNDEQNTSNNQSLILSPHYSSPLFSGDDEVLSVLLATVSSTLAPKSDIQAGHTQAAIESLVSYVTDRMRMDMSRMI